MNASETQETAPKPRKRRGRRILIGTVLVLVLVLVLGPLLAAPFVKGKVLAALGENLQGEARLEGVSFSLLGSVGLDGLAIDDAGGAPVLALEKVRGKVDLWGLLRKRYDASLRAEGFELHVRRMPDGSLNLQGLGKDTPGGTKSGDGGGGGERGGKDREKNGGGADKEVPDVGIDLKLTRGRLVIHGDDGDTEFRELEMEMVVDRLDGPGRMSMSVRPYGPAGPGGLVKAHGTFQIADNGGFRGEALRADLQFLLQDLDLAAFQPAAQTFGEVETLAGAVQGSAVVRIRQQGFLDVESAIDLTGLRATGGAAGAEGLRMDSLRWRSKVVLDESGAGTQTFSLAADDFLDVAYQGTSGAVRRENAELTGALEVDARMKGLLAAMRGVMPVREGMTIAGRFQGSAQVVAGIDAGNMKSLGSQGSFGLQEFTVRDAQGAPVDLGGLEAFRFDYEGSLRPEIGEAELVRMVLEAGPVRATGHGAVHGLVEGSEASLEDSEIVAGADLDKLVQVLEGFLDLGDTRFGGRLDLRTSARQDDGVVVAEGRLEAKGLFFENRDADGQPQRVGPLAIQIDQRGRLDLGAGGTSRFESISVQSDFLQLEASGAFTDLADPELIRGSLQHTGTFHPDRLAAILGPLAGGLGLRGEAIAMQGGMQVDGTNWSTTGSLDSPGLRLLGDAYGPQGRAIPAFRTDFEAAGGADGAPLTAKLDLKSAGIAIDAQGQMQPGDAPTSDWTVGLDLQPGAITRGFADWLEGAVLEGEALTGTLTLATRGERADVKADLKGARLMVQLPPAAPVDGMPASTEPRRLRQRDLAVLLDASYMGEPGDLDVRRASYASRTATASVTGKLRGLADVDTATADLVLQADGPVAALLADFGPMAGLQDWKGSGTLGARYTMRGGEGRWRIEGGSWIDALVLELPRPGDADLRPKERQGPVRIEEQKLELKIGMDLAPGPMDLVIEEARLDSAFLRGTVKGEVRNLASLTPAADDADARPDVLLSGLLAEFTYVPDTLGALLAPFVPGELSGAAPEQARVSFDGRLQDFNPFELLRGGQGSALVGLGDYRIAGLETRGTLEVTVEGQRTVAKTRLAANGGTLEMDAVLDMRETGGARAEGAPAAGNTIKVRGSAIGANAAMSGFLGRANPLLAGLDTEGANLGGLLNFELDLSYAGSLTPAQLAGGLSDIPTDELRGRGRLALDEAKLQGSPLFGEFLGKLGMGGDTPLKFSPIAFRIRSGNLRYEEPIQLAIGPLQTTLDGAVGLDGVLAMKWQVPVTAELAGKLPLLSGLQGEMLEVPIGGDLGAPKMQWDQAVKGLAEKVAKGKLGDALGDKIPGGVGEKLPGGIGEKLPGGLGDVLGGKKNDEGKAAELLERADKLYDRGRKDEARAVYLELRGDHKETKVFKTNRDQVNARIREGKGGDGDGR